VNLYLLTHSAKGNRFHPDIFTFGGILQGQRIGYVRVSSFDQNPDRQLEQIGESTENGKNSTLSVRHAAATFS
jgi:hypothetical protein